MLPYGGYKVEQKVYLLRDTLKKEEIEKERERDREIERERERQR